MSYHSVYKEKKLIKREKIKILQMKRILLILIIYGNPSTRTMFALNQIFFTYFQEDVPKKKVYSSEKRRVMRSPQAHGGTRKQNVPFIIIDLCCSCCHYIDNDSYKLNAYHQVI